MALLKVICWALIFIIRIWNQIEKRFYFLFFWNFAKVFIQAIRTEFLVTVDLLYIIFFIEI